MKSTVVVTDTKATIAWKTDVYLLTISEDKEIFKEIADEMELTTLAHIFKFGDYVVNDELTLTELDIFLSFEEPVLVIDNTRGRDAYYGYIVELVALRSALGLPGYSKILLENGSTVLSREYTEYLQDKLTNEK